VQRLRENYVPFEAASYVQTIERRQGIKIGCPEKAAYRSGFSSLNELQSLIGKMPPCEYRHYLEMVIAEAKRNPHASLSESLE
jgi:glucose-1-phosphate thymidylyltransferase